MGGERAEVAIVWLCLLMEEEALMESTHAFFLIVMIYRWVNLSMYAEKERRWFGNKVAEGWGDWFYSRKLKRKEGQRSDHECTNTITINPNTRGPTAFTILQHSLPFFIPSSTLQHRGTTILFTCIPPFSIFNISSIPTNKNLNYILEIFEQCKQMKQYAEAVEIKNINYLQLFFSLTHHQSISFLLQ